MKTRTKGQNKSTASDGDTGTGPLAVRLFLVILYGAIVMAAPLAQAQTFQVLHAFSDRGDDASPYAGLTVDSGGNFYGTTLGWFSNGSVFKLTHSGSGWVLNTLYNFGRLGSGPAAIYSRVTIGPDGALYGTTSAGGRSGVGTVFKLQPPTSVCGSSSCPWTLTILHEFSGPDGASPRTEVVFDPAGNLYGATLEGGTPCMYDSEGCGVVFELSQSGGGWTETILYDFGLNGYGFENGALPMGGLIFDAAGNLYGTTFFGGAGYGAGVVYELTPTQGGGWTQSVLHGFNGLDGFGPVGTLIMDGAGNLYGDTFEGGPNSGGTVYQLSPGGQFQVLYNFPTNRNPRDGLMFDSAGNLYGTTVVGGANGYGTVFNLTPSQGSWIETDLHYFEPSDGEHPYARVALGPDGNLYGTAADGGHFSGICFSGCGTVWQITP
jgi:uncharacterized repeat protein (TIGR03803 family)